MLTNANMTFPRLWYSRTDRTEVVCPIGSDSVILVVRDHEGLIAPVGDPKKNSRHFHFCRDSMKPPTFDTRPRQEVSYPETRGVNFV